MSFLSDTDIRKILKTGQDERCDHHLVINPFDEESLTPVGYDLRVGKFYQSNQDNLATNLEEGDYLTLTAGSTTNIRTLEWLAQPKDKTFSGLICSKVSLVSRGLSHVSTTIDPDWSGHLSISIHNHADHDIQLRVGQRFCTAVFVRNISAATKDSGHGPSRTDTLISAISLQERLKIKKGNRRAKIIAAIGLSICLVIIAALIYLIFRPLSSDPTFNATYAAGACVGGILIATLVSPIIQRLVFGR